MKLSLINHCRSPPTITADQSLQSGIYVMVCLIRLLCSSNFSASASALGYITAMLDVVPGLLKHVGTLLLLALIFTAAVGSLLVQHAEGVFHKVL